jgi:hypothetical protein
MQAKEHHQQQLLNLIPLKNTIMWDKTTSGNHHWNEMNELRNDKQNHCSNSSNLPI